MSSLKRNESITITVTPLPSGVLSVKTELAITTPRAGRKVVALFETIRVPDFPYESSGAYLAKRIRNSVAGATFDPELI